MQASYSQLYTFYSWLLFFSIFCFSFGIVDCLVQWKSVISIPLCCFFSAAFLFDCFNVSVFVRTIASVDKQLAVNLNVIFLAHSLSSHRNYVVFPPIHLLCGLVESYSYKQHGECSRIACIARERRDRTPTTIRMVFQFKLYDFTQPLNGKINKIIQLQRRFFFFFQFEYPDSYILQLWQRHFKEFIFQGVLFSSTSVQSVLVTLIISMRFGWSTIIHFKTVSTHTLQWCWIFEFSYFA